MKRVEISADQCKGCGLCVSACPQHCLSLGRTVNSIGYQYAEFKPGKCNACGFCYYICPEPGAITVISEKEPKTSGA